MQTVLQQPYVTSYRESAEKVSLIQKFLTWSKNQEEFRFVWLAVILSAHGTLITPLTLFIVMYTGNSMFAFVLAIAAMGISLVANLAALPTKITIPVFFFSVALDLGVIITNLAFWL